MTSAPPLACRLAPPPRLVFLDWLRAAAFGLLVLYHVGMYYVSWDWHIKSPHASDALEPLMMLSSPWRLALLFLISGVATSRMLMAQAAPPRGGGFVRQRSARLLLPLLFGMWVVVPPQAYLEVVEKLGYQGGYRAFMGLYMEGYGGFCTADGCLDLPTWNHLWFVAYLWVYSMVLWGAVRLWPAGLERGVACAQAWLAPTWRRWVAPVAVLALWRLLLIGRFPPTHGLDDDFYNHALYFSVFLAGAMLARADEGVWRWFAVQRWRALLTALALWACIAAYFHHFRGDSVPPDALRAVQRIGYAALQWAAIVAALGFARQHWNHDHPWRARLSEAVFPVYLLHQTVIILLAWWLRPAGLAPWVEAPVLIAGTALVCMAGAVAAERAGPARLWLGLPHRRRGACQAAASRPARLDAY